MKGVVARTFVIEIWPSLKISFKLHETLYLSNILNKNVKTNIVDPRITRAVHPGCFSSIAFSENLIFPEKP